MSSGISFAAFYSQLKASLPAFAAAVDLKLQASMRQMVALRTGSATQRGQQGEALALLRARPQSLAQAYGRCLLRRLAEELADMTAAEPSMAHADTAASRPLALSLMDEQEVEQGIEQVRMERQIEQAVEWPLRDLRSLCAALPGRTLTGLDDACPLTPALAAEALAIALDEIDVPRGLRLTLLRAAGSGLASELAALYLALLNTLRSAGVEPAPLRIVPSIQPSAPPFSGQPAGGRREGDAADRAGGVDQAIARLFAAGFGHPAGAAPGLPGDAASAADRSAQSQAMTRLPVATGQQLAQLLQILSRQSQSGPAMDAIWQRLLEPVQRMGATALADLQQTDHPFWRLLDRIAMLSTVQAQSGPAMRELAARLEPVMAQLERGASLTAEQFDTALAELDTLPGADLPDASQAMESVLDLEARRREIEPAVRSQLVWQLRPLALPAVLKQFLLGPWVEVLTHALSNAGPDSPSTMRFMNHVADLLAAVSQQRRGQALQDSERQPLLDVAEEGMRAGGLPEHVVQGCLNDLAAVLAGAQGAVASGTRPEAEAGLAPVLPAVEDDEDSHSSEADEYVDSGTDEWLGHAELATVQTTFSGGSEASQTASQAWTEGLQVGGLCRLMLQGRWVTAMLSWRSENGMFFMFKSRHTAGTHTLTLRSLVRMRSEGLATSIAPGQMLARALQALAGPG